jgi:hypothetical protein
MNSINLASGVELREIPISPNSDYMAGSDGQIYSRTRYKGFGRKEYTDWYPLVGHRTKKGYLTVSLCHNNIKVTKTVHRLICMAFHGMPESKSMQVRHLDGDPNNNVPNNLKWGTQYENWMDRKAHGHGEKHPMSKLTNKERGHIAWAMSKGICSQRQVARALGMSQSAISSLVHSFKE